MQLFAVVPQQQLVTDFKNSESYDRAGNSFTGELSCPSYPRLIRFAHLSLALGGASAATMRGRQLPLGASAATTSELVERLQCARESNSNAAAKRHVFHNCAVAAVFSLSLHNSEMNVV